MGKVKDLQRRKINASAVNFLCDQPEGDLYEAYLELKNAQKIGHGNDPADNFVDVPQAFEHLNVDQIVDFIESAAHNETLLPEVLTNVDWPLLKKQKASLLKVIESIDDVPILEHLEGIIAFIDSIQDYVVDTCGMNENEVLNLTKED